MTTIATLAVKLIGNVKDYVSAMDQAEGKARSSAAEIGQTMKNIGKGMTDVGKVATVGLTLPIVAFAASSVKSAMDSENSLAELNAVIKSTGGAAGVTAEEVVKMASGLQKVTKFADDDIVSGQSMLLTFTKIGKDVFPQATEAMLNMAEKFGSMDAASVQLGKALNDPIAGVTALRKVGVTLSAQQEDQIKKFMAQNDIASAQKVILKELETEFGGLARAAGETTAGKMAQLNNEFDDLKETVGTYLIPYLMQGANFLKRLIEGFMNLPAPVQKGILVILAIAAAIGPLLVVLGTITSSIGSIITFASTLGPVLAGLGPALATIGTVITGTVLPAIGSLLAALAPIILPILAIIAVLALLYFAWKNNWGNIRGVTAAALAWLKQAFTAGVGSIKSIWQSLQPAIQFVLTVIRTIVAAWTAAFNGDWRRFGQLMRQVWDMTWGALINAVATAGNRIRNAIGNLISNAINAFKHTDWGEVGKNIVLGIANGITSGVKWIVDAAKKAAQAALDAVQGFLGIHSESKVFKYQVGWEMGAGTASGFGESIDHLLKPQFGNLAPTAAVPGLNAGGVGGGSSNAEMIALLRQIANKPALNERELGRVVRDLVVQVTK